jgi:hypothetical protein
MKEDLLTYQRIRSMKETTLFSGWMVPVMRNSRVTRIVLIVHNNPQTYDDLIYSKEARLHLNFLKLLEHFQRKK